MSETFAMTEAEEAAFSAALADPSILKTQAEVAAIADVLLGDIDQLEGELEGAQYEHGICPLSEARLDWVRRASCKLSFLRRELRPLLARYSEIGGDFDAEISALALAETERLAIKDVNRKGTVKLQEMGAGNKIARSFVHLARNRMAPELFDELYSEATKATGA